MKNKIPLDMVSGTIHKTENYGFIEVLEYESYSCVLIKFKNTGLKTTTRSDSIRNGSVKDPTSPMIYGIGFIGVGNYSSSKGKHQKIYDTWRSMFVRCYDESYQMKKPTYKGCSVDPIWHNFQNFAEWYDSNKPNTNGVIHLDKDIIVKNNKVYSPNKCCLVPAEVNISFTSSKQWVFTSPRGENVNIESLRSFCIKNELSESSMRMVNNGKRKQHKGWTKA